MISKPLHREANFFTESTCDITIVIFPQTTQKIFSGIHTSKNEETEAYNIS
jgi:hypothetical protein